MYRTGLKYVEAKYPQFNSERLDFKSLLDICEEEEITFHELTKIPKNVLRSYIQWPQPPKIKETVIVVNKACPEFVKSFCLGHELGHYFLHPPHLNRDNIKELEERGDIPREFIRELKDAYENEADLFATIAFIPDTELIEKFPAVINFRDAFIEGGVIDRKKVMQLEERVFEYLTAETIKTLKSYGRAATKIMSKENEANINLRLRAQCFIRAQVWTSPFSLDSKASFYPAKRVVTAKAPFNPIPS